MKSQLYIKMWRKHVCTWSSFYLIVKAEQTHFPDEVEALDDVDFEDDLGNELCVEDKREIQLKLILTLIR